MPAALKARIAARVADTNFSAYVSEVLAREERRLALIDFLDYMDDLYGPPTDEEMAEADRDPGFDRTSVHYLLPADGGASGSGVFNLDGDVIGQVACGNSYSASERVTVLPSKYGLYALEIDIDAVRLLPSPLALSSRVPINPGLSTSGAPSNYIRELVEQSAPGELP